MRIIRKLQGLDGRLSRSNTAILNALMTTPDPDLWQRAKNIIVCDQPLVTLNAAVRAVTQGQVIIGEFPDTFTLYRALKYAVEKRQRCYHQMEVSDNES